VAWALFGLGCGLAVARAPKRLWIGSYVVCLAVLVIFGVKRYTVGLEMVPPFSWFAAGRIRFAIALIAPVMVFPLSARIPSGRTRLLCTVFVGLLSFQYGVMPTVSPVLARREFLSLKTLVDAQGVCLQQTGYTCGPAAAITGLRALGLNAEEGELSIWARTCSATGTDPDTLAEVLQTHFEAQGLQVDLRGFKSIDELAKAGVTLAVIKYSFWVDHFVTVLKVNGDQVVVGDPLSGRTIYTREDFAKVWRFTGIVLSR